MSEQPTTVRTDELAPGDRLWHPYEIAPFTVAHTPRPETGLHFEGEPGLRVTGTSDRGETVHVDVSPAHKWHRAPIRDQQTAVREVGALPVPIGVAESSASQEPRTMLDLARDALSARMAKDDLRLVLENVVTYAATLEARVAALEATTERFRATWRGHTGAFTTSYREAWEQAESAHRRGERDAAVHHYGHLRREWVTGTGPQSETGGGQ